MGPKEVSKRGYYWWVHGDTAEIVEVLGDASIDRGLYMYVIGCELSDNMSDMEGDFFGPIIYLKGTSYGH